MVNRLRFVFALTCILQLPLHIFAQVQPAAIVWGSSVPGAQRPTPAQTLAHYRAEYPTPMDTTAHIAELLNRVAWDYRDLGMKLLGKNSGANCPLPNGVLISCDYLVDGATKTGHDVFRDAGAGGATEPQSFDWGPGEEDLSGAINSGVRSLVDPVSLLQPPTPAQAYSPENQASGVLLTPESVIFTGPGDTFDVYFGTTNPPPVRATGITLNTVPVGPLASGTIYFWRVNSKNAAGLTVGPVWSFSTAIIVPPVTPPPVEPPARKFSIKTILAYIAAAIGAIVFCASGACN